VITDGQMSGLVNKGISVAEVSPEGAVGGPLGLVEDGDIISIDVTGRRIDLEVTEVELTRRRARLPCCPRRRAAAGSRSTPARCGR
jgi:dihydroxy-acid dehydratase